MAGSDKSRRDLLLGRTCEQPAHPEAGSTLRLAVHAMACDFAAAVNPGQTDQLLACGDAMEIVPHIESWLSTYQPNSELSRLNAGAGDAPTEDEIRGKAQEASGINTDVSSGFC